MGDLHIEVFDRVWETTRDHIYPGSLSSRFTEQQRTALRAQAASARSLEDLDRILNPFLRSLGVSHTRFYRERDPDYVFMRSLFRTGDPDAEPLWQIGIQTAVDGAVRVREVLDGSPAKQAGLRRGDALLECDGKRFDAFACFENGRRSILRVARREQKLDVVVEPRLQAPARAFIDAMIASARIEIRGGARIGYIHFWIGSFDENVREYKRLLESFAGRIDALVLDLRGGFGGAWLDHVDPFFANRLSYPVARSIDREGRVRDPVLMEPHVNPNAFLGPMAVLINEGTRSGKEAMAFQFKQSGRATIVGTTTAGMFVAGRMWFAEEDNGYILYLANNGVTLDGVNLEGVGVAPDIEVPYPLTVSLSEDPQLAVALDVAVGKVRSR